MNIGYACLTAGIPNTKQRTCTMKNATPERLYELIEHNLLALKNITEFNAKNRVFLFRISSDLIPFGSSPVNTLDWPSLFKKQFNEIGNMLQKNNIRVSMHPGQYTVLNSPNPDVVFRAIDDLIYHQKVLSALGTYKSSKIVVHIGGVYNDKEEALKRFERVFKGLDSSIKDRLIIENDDKSYCIEDVLSLGEKNSIPVVYDNLHSDINHSPNRKSHAHWIEKCAATWSKDDGSQKIHYSQQAEGKNPGSHSQTIDVKHFLRFIRDIKPLNPDIMLEVKDKNISAIKCINSLFPDAKYLMMDWERHKYKVLEHSPTHVATAQKIMKQDLPDAVKLYETIDSAYLSEPDTQSQIMAAKEVWSATASAMNENFAEKVKLFNSGKYSYTNLKKFIYKAAMEVGDKKLISSFYFHL